MGSHRAIRLLLAAKRAIGIPSMLSAMNKIVHLHTVLSRSLIWTSMAILLLQYDEWEGSTIHFAILEGRDARALHELALAVGTASVLNEDFFVIPGVVIAG